MSTQSFGYRPPDRHVAGRANLAAAAGAAATAAGGTATGVGAAVGVGGVEPAVKVRGL